MADAEECRLCSLVGPGAPEDTWVLHNDLVTAYDNGSAIPGWYQLQVNRHASYIGELTEPEAAAIGSASVALGVAVTEVTGASRVYSYAMCEFVPHFHLVIGAAPELAADVARGAPLLSRIMVRDAELQDPARAAEVTEKVRAALAH
jgi:hypothetical protein